MKKRFFCGLLCCILCFLALRAPVSSLAAETGPVPEAAPEATPLPEGEPGENPDPEGERTFSTVEVIEAPDPESGYSVTGILLWSLLFAVVLVICGYMIFHLIRMRREEKIRQANEAMRPRLIITRGFTGRRERP